MTKTKKNNDKHPNIYVYKSKLLLLACIFELEKSTILINIRLHTCKLPTLRHNFINCNFNNYTLNIMKVTCLKSMPTKL